MALPEMRLLETAIVLAEADTFQEPRSGCTSNNPLSASGLTSSKAGLVSGSLSVATRLSS